MKPLSAKQKSVLCQIARRAFAHLLAAGKIAGVDFDPWRRDEVERATGRHGLRECGDPHYRPLAAHFESLAGEDGRALNHLLAANTDARRKMEVVLLRALEGAGLGLPYAEKISRDRLKHGLLETTDAELRAILITVKTRIQSRRRPSANAPAAPQPHGLAC